MSVRQSDKTEAGKEAAAGRCEKYGIVTTPLMSCIADLPARGNQH